MSRITAMQHAMIDGLVVSQKKGRNNVMTIMCIGVLRREAELDAKRDAQKAAAKARQQAMVINHGGNEVEKEFRDF